MRLTAQQFEQLALEHLDMLYRIARRLTHNPVTAEDLVQETYLRAFRACDSFDLQQYGMRPWLVRILQNLYYSRSGREKRQPVGIDAEALDAAAVSLQPPLTPGSWDGMDERLVRAVNELPGEYQVVLLLWALEDFSYKEIAAALDVPLGTVMSRLHRARKRLAEQLREYAQQERIIRE
jgi:RNA polymerase sigma-70 factor, ECF subfamily